MGNWNYTTGNRNEYSFSYGRYVKHHVDLKARGKQSGITFDLRDAFQDLEKKGMLKDLKKDGFTKEDALNLYNELDKIHQERQLNRDYKKMAQGSKFDYSEAEVRRLANAAGYQTYETLDVKQICQTDHTGVAPRPSKNAPPPQAQEDKNEGFFKRLYNRFFK